MKFELKTENENFSKSFSQFFRVGFFLILKTIKKGLTNVGPGDGELPF